MRNNDLTTFVLALIVCLICCLNGCGSITETMGDVVEMRDAGPVSSDVRNDAGPDAVAQPPEPNPQADASVGDAQPNDLGDAQPNQNDGAADTGQEVTPSCGPVTVCYQCPTSVQRVCGNRNNGVWVCCTQAGLLSCDLTRCTPG